MQNLRTFRGGKRTCSAQTQFLRNTINIDANVATIAEASCRINRHISAGLAGATMHANITTWLISDVARKSANFQAFLQNWQPNSYRQFFQFAAPQIVPILRTHGMIQSFAIRTRVDLVTIVSIFEDEAGAEAAWAEISGRLHVIMEGSLEFMEYSSGPVEDLMRLGSGLPCPEG